MNENNNTILISLSSKLDMYAILEEGTYALVMIHGGGQLNRHQ